VSLGEKTQCWAGHHSNSGAQRDSVWNPGAPISVEKETSLTFPEYDILRAFSATVLSLKPF